jgi:hypothetical protein
MFIARGMVAALSASRIWRTAPAAACPLLSHLVNCRHLHAHNDRDLVDLDQQFYQGKPAANQIDFVIVKKPVLGILCLQGHAALL